MALVFSFSQQPHVSAIWNSVMLCITRLKGNICYGYPIDLATLCKSVMLEQTPPELTHIVAKHLWFLI